MPPTALICSLGKMTSIGLLAPMSDAVGTVLAKLSDAEQLKRSRVHPFSILLAQTTYAAGCGVKGDLKWNPVPQINDVLNDTFYASFNHVRPTGKRHYLALDVSGSMGWATSKIANSHITARVGAACGSINDCSKQCPPIQALDRYRQATGINSKLAVVAMCSNGHSIADPNDAGTLDIVGFDASAPAILAEFAGYSKADKAGFDNDGYYA